MNKLIAQMQKFNKYKYLMTELVVRDVKLKYRRSVLGYLWSLLNPLLTMIVVSTVFSFVFKQDIVNFPIYLLIGQIMFQFFSESTTMAMGSIIQNGSLIKKVYIPKYIFPISKVLSCGVNFLFSLAALFLVMLFTATAPSWYLLLIPIPVFFVMVFSIGIGMILSVYAVYFRDLIHLYGVFTTMLMYLTPIFYPISALPEGIKWLINANPLTQFVTCMRTIVLERSCPTAENIIFCAVWCVISMVAGIVIFKRKQSKFVLYI